MAGVLHTQSQTNSRLAYYKPNVVRASPPMIGGAQLGVRANVTTHPKGEIVDCSRGWAPEGHVGGEAELPSPHASRAPRQYRSYQIIPILERETAKQRLCVLFLSPLRIGLLCYLPPDNREKIAFNLLPARNKQAK